MIKTIYTKKITHKNKEQNKTKRTKIKIQKTIRELVCDRGKTLTQNKIHQFEVVHRILNKFTNGTTHKEEGGEGKSFPCRVSVIFATTAHKS